MENAAEKNEHQLTDIAPELVRSTARSVWDISAKNLPTYTFRQRILSRIKELELSVRDYLARLSADSEERAYVGLSPEDKVVDRATVFRWLNKANNPVALARGVGGTGRASTIPNWVACFILEKLCVDSKASATVIYKCMEAFAAHHNYYLPAECTIWRFMDAIKQKGGIQDMLRKLQTRRYYSTYQLAIRHVYSHANHIWETDATAMPILVRENLGDKKPKRIWLLITVDCFSGVMVGCTVLFGDPVTNDLILHLHQCLVNFGKPVILQSDNARIYTSRAFLATCAELGIELRKSPPYCPAYNGCIERLNQTFKKQIKSYYVEVAKRYRLFAERNEVFIGSFEKLKDVITEGAEEYNKTRGPSHTKDTYYSVWYSGLKSADDGYCDPKVIDRHCLAFEEHTVVSEGVLVRGKAHFIHESLVHYKGEDVEVRYNLFGDPTYVLAKLGGEWVRLEENSEKNKRLLGACKKSRSQDFEVMREVSTTLQETSNRSMELHSPGTAKSIAENKKRPRVKEEPLPEKPLSIPILKTATFSF